MIKSPVKCFVKLPIPAQGCVYCLEILRQLAWAWSRATYREWTAAENGVGKLVALISLFPFVNNCICFLGLGFLFGTCPWEQALSIFSLYYIRSHGYRVSILTCDTTGALRDHPQLSGHRSTVYQAAASFVLTEHPPDLTAVTSPYCVLFPVCYHSSIAVISKTAIKYSSLLSPFLLYIFCHVFLHLLHPTASDCPLNMVFSRLLSLTISNINSSSATSLKSS